MSAIEFDASKVRVAMLGPVGPAQLACLKSWRRHGVVTHFLDTEQAPLPRLVQGVASHYDHIGPAGNLDAQRLQTICAALNRSGARAICCLGEQLAIRLWQERSNLPPGTVVLSNPDHVMRLLESKLEQITLGEKAGFSILPTELISSDNLDQIAPRLQFPLALRPDRASVDRSFKAQYVHDLPALRAFFAQRPAQAPAVLAQKFISGPGIVVHGSRNSRGGHGPLHAYVSKLKYQGVTVYMEPFALPESELSACRNFADLLDLRGIFHFDLMLDTASGQVWFLEINARLGGTTAKVLAAGYDEPRRMLQAYDLLPDSMSAGATLPQKSVVNRLAALRCLFGALRGNSSRIDDPLSSRWRVALQSVRAALFCRDEVLSVRQPLSSLAFLAQYLR